MPLHVFIKTRGRCGVSPLEWGAGRREKRLKQGKKLFPSRESFSRALYQPFFPLTPALICNQPQTCRAFSKDGLSPDPRPFLEASLTFPRIDTSED